MPDEIRVNRPQVQPQRHDGTQSPMSDVRDRMDGGKSSSVPWIVLGVVVVVLIVLGVAFRQKLFGGKVPGGNVLGATTSSSSGYQAVFLTNGQVYFGKLSNADGEYPMLTDIYYLQVVQPPLQGSGQQAQTGQGQQAATAQPQISLVKLGQELHGPVDEMHIAKSQILFYEDMKGDSQVVKAIQSYKANPTGAQAPAAVPTK